MANVPLRPLGVNYFGVFLCPIPGGDYNAAWTTGYNFVEGFKDQIDAAQTLGANLIVFISAVTVVPSGAALTTYLGRMRQVIEYIGSKGMYALPYGAGTMYQWLPTVSNTQASTLFAAVAAVVSQYPHVIGMALTDEPWESATDHSGTLSDATIVANLAEQYAAVRAVVPSNFPVTAAPNPNIQSSTASLTYSGAAQTRCDSVAPYCDFFAFHPFHDITTADSAAIRAAYPGKDIIFPSSVLTHAFDSAGVIASRNASIMGQVGSNRIRGMAQFLVRDFDASQFGMFTADASTPPILTPRTNMTSQFVLNNRAVDLTNRRRIPGKPRLQQLKEKGYA